MFRPFFAVIVLSYLIACAPQDPAGQGAEETCPKTAYASLIGQDINAAVIPLDVTYRVIFPDSAVTMDHAPDRLNVHVNDAGIVQRLSCG